MHLYGTARVNSGGNLEIGGCDTVDLAQEFGTPLYIIDEGLVRTRCREYKEALRTIYPKSDVAYASKAFLCTSMARLMDDEGFSLDVVSGGELYTALRAMFPPERIYFHGNNKTMDEMEMAIRARVGRFVVDSPYELEVLNDVARQLRARPNVLLRITPGIEAHTHEYIQTGQLDSKFGINIYGGLALGVLKRSLALRHINVVGLHCHVGSQILDLEAFRLTANRMMDFLAEIRTKLGITLTELNVGGGLGVRYVEGDEPPTVEAMVRTLAQAIRRKSEEFEFPMPKLVLEPGRSIISEAGTTLYTVGTIKEIPGLRTYVSVDGGMADNPRPALYQAKYEAVVANKVLREVRETVSIAGRCCESGDMLIWDIALPEVAPGDTLAVFCTGAYNYSMASHYNRLPKPAVVLCRDGQADVIVRRETYENLVAQDVIPARLMERKALRAAL